MLKNHQPKLQTLTLVIVHVMSCFFLFQECLKKISQRKFLRMISFPQGIAQFKAYGAFTTHREAYIASTLQFPILCENCLLLFLLHRIFVQFAS